MKRFTISLYDVAADYESKSWIALTPAEAGPIRSSLQILGLPFLEDEVPAQSLLFDLLVTHCDHGSRSAYTYRTRSEVETIISANLNGFHALPASQAEALTEFLGRPDGPSCFAFNDTNTELNVERMHAGQLVRANDRQGARTEAPANEHIHL